MKLLNLCCGSVRVVDDTWVNLDNLHEMLLPGTPERANLDAELNYVNWNVEANFSLSLFPDETFDGILASHCIEHFDCHKASMLMNACRALLKPGGVLLVSVPDAAVFRKNHAEDTVENAVRLFGEPIHLPDGETTFANYALWNRFHKAILTEDALWCYFVRAGFEAKNIHRIETSRGGAIGMWGEASVAATRAAGLLNRLPFSLILAATKS